MNVRGADVVPDRPEFNDGYTFDPSNPNTFTNSTSITIFDDLGNPTIATMYFIKTQSASANDPTNKYDTRLVINDTVSHGLVPSVDDAGIKFLLIGLACRQLLFRMITTSLKERICAYKRDDLQTLVDSQPGN